MSCYELIISCVLNKILMMIMTMMMMTTMMIVMNK